MKPDLNLFLCYMKLIFPFFNFFVAILVFGCSGSKKNIAVSVEMEQGKNNFAKKDQLLTNLLYRYPQYFKSILDNNDKWKAQIIYTQIDRGQNGDPSFTNHYFNVDKHRYYYPASTVKMPVAVLSLQRLNELKITGITKKTTMITDEGLKGQTGVFNDPTSEDGRPTIEHYIKKIFLVSDNDAFNRLYEFLGQEYINNSLHRMGYDSAQIIHRLSIAMNEEQNRTTNPIKFYNAANKIIYQQPLIRSDLSYHPRQILLGKGFISGDKLINEPFDFSKKNRLALTDLHSMLLSIMFPASVSKDQRFNLTEEDYRFLYRQMSMLPKESKFPSYDTSYSDAYVKFLLYGGSGAINAPFIRIFNKVGDAYGFLTDAAYIADFKNNIEFILSANIYCNTDEIFNDDNYDYDTVGFPFMKNLGKVIYDYELKRQRKTKPDLSSFKINYAD